MQTSLVRAHRSKDKKLNNDIPLWKGTQNADYYNLGAGKTVLYNTQVYNNKRRKKRNSVNSLMSEYYLNTQFQTLH